MTETNMDIQVSQAIRDLELERIGPLLEDALGRGISAESLLDAMSAGMLEVGELFQQGEYFLADLVLAGEVMREGLSIIEPRFKVQRGAGRGTVVLCTVSGDVHDIGKRIVATMLTGAGFQVVDLGVDVPASRVVEAVQRSGARAVGLSVLLTPMVPAITEVVAGLTAAGLRAGVKIAIGGACTTPELVCRLGVDALGRDAVEAVQIFGSFLDRAGDRP